MGSEPAERLLELEVSQVVEHHGQEAGVHEVEHRVLVSPDVRAHREPPLGDLFLEGAIVEVGGRVAEEVPATVQERVGDVGLPACRLPALGAGDLVPLLHPGQGGDSRIVGLEVLDTRQDYRKVLLRDRHGTAAVAVDHRDRGTPVPLPRDAPVVETEVDPELTQTPLAQPLRDGTDGDILLHSVETPRVHQAARADVGLRERGVGVFAFPGHDSRDRQAEFLRELEVPLVVARYGHDGARAVVHQHVVRDPDRDRLPGGRVPAVPPGEHAGLGLVRLLAGHEISGRGFLPVRLHRFPLLIRHKQIHGWMLGCQHHEGGAEDRVGARGEHPDGVRLVPGSYRLRVHGLGTGLAGNQRESQLRPLAPPDPVPLRLGGGLGPVDPVQVVQEALGVLRNGEEPLGDLPLLHGCVTPLTEPSHHLLVGQDGHAGGTPVHRCFLSLRQTGLEELKEDPLGPAIVRRIRGVYGVIPVEHPADPAKLASEVRHVLRNKVHGVDPHLQREVLGVDSERVEADGLEDVLSPQPLVAAVHVRAGEGVDVPHV